MTAIAADLATELNGRVVELHGDIRILVGTDIIYAAFGKVKLDHRGRITVLGTCADSVDDLAGSYRAAVGTVRS